MSVFLILFVFLYALYAGFVWRLRGGALATFTPIHVGTTVTRMICGAMLAAPLAITAWNPWYGLLAVTIWIGLSLVGWGPFMAMNVGTKNDATGPYASLMNLIGLPIGVSVWRDILGFGVCGFVTMLPTSLTLLGLDHFGLVSVPFWWILLPAGFSITFVYYIFSKLNLSTWPVIKNFVDYHKPGFQQWAEIGTGVLVGASLALVTVLF